MVAEHPGSVAKLLVTFCYLQIIVFFTFAYFHIWYGSQNLRLIRPYCQQGQTPRQTASVSPSASTPETPSATTEREKVCGRFLLSASSLHCDPAEVTPPLVLDLKGRTLLRPPPSAVIHASSGNIRMPQPFLHLGDVRPMG